MLVLVGGVIVGFGCPWLGGSDDGDISVDGVLVFFFITEYILFS